MQYRKDCSPIETINRIRLILKKNRIKIKKTAFSFGRSFFSYRLELKGFHGIGTNGKGFSKDTALASAYAELMERLQARFLIRPYFLNKSPLKKIFPDEEFLSVENFENLCKDFFVDRDLKKSIKYIDSNNEVYRYALPFYNYFEKKIELVPHRLINILTHSNGLCAGNTYEEALSHGICEIFERYVYKKIMLGSYIPETIKLEHLEKLTSNSLLNEIEQLGYTYEIKDCSFEFKFPVVGIIIFNKQKQRAVFAVGCDLDFDIALQRCLTEIFQGLTSVSDLENKMASFLEKKDDIYTNWIKSYVANIGKVPKYLLRSDRIKVKIPSCFSEVKTNKEALEKLLNILRKNNLSLYIKDLSYLSFPTYKLYIPGLSEIETLSKMDLHGIENRGFLISILCNLLHSSKKDLNRSKKLIQLFNTNLFYTTLNLPGSYFGMKGLLKADIVESNFLYLLSIIENCLKDLKMKEKIPCCPNCKKCKISCNYKNWEKYNTLLNNKYIGYLINKNSIRKDMSISVEELRSEMTQCRIIQIDKHLEKQNVKI